MASLSILPRPTEPPALTGAERERLARELSNAIEGEVRFGLHDRMLYATDASLYQVEPLGVVIPASIDDAVRAVEFCAVHHLPILPRGGGTSLAGQCTNRAVVIDFSPRCTGLRAIDVADRSCVVEPGITVDDLNDALATSRLFFAPDPATSRQANVGGCIGNNAAGGRSIRYGRTSESLIGVEVCLANGVRVKLERGGASRDERVREITRRVADVVGRHAALIRERFPRTVRRNAGYNLDLILSQMKSAREGVRAGGGGGQGADLDAINLSHLVCGSEGTLAVTLLAELRLHPVPAARGLAVVGLASLDEAIEAVESILATGPSAVELLDDTILDLARANPEYSRYVDLMPGPALGPLRAVLYVEYSGADADELRASFDALSGALARRAPTSRTATYTDGPSMLKAWKLRKAGEPLLHGMPGERKPITFVEDNAVPVEHLPHFVREFRRIVESHGTRAAFWAHASVGVLHVRPFLNLRDEADRERLRRIAVEVADLARSLGGVMSGEHGDGRVRGPLLERFYGPELMGAFREIKAIFDPRNLLNPGNIVEPGPIGSITERLRIKPDESRPLVQVPPVETYFDYADQHGFAGAVEMCNGAGVCRKKSGGTMCPSYMATLDERHSTRGRGNALRLAITGQLTGAEGGGAGGGAGSASWDDPETIRTLDLCLSCKACKTECPSNVDIARLKAEYAAQRYRRTGRVPLRAGLFGHVRTLNRLGATSPRLVNWLGRRTLIRAIMNRALGLSPRRSIPAFDRSLMRQWGSARAVDASSPGATGITEPPPGLAFFADCFTSYNEPPIGLAAKRVLGALGYDVRLMNAGCCGRALISTGLLENGIATADATLDRLRPAIEDPGVRAILVCEPSCLSAFKDDWLQLRLRTPIDLRKRLASKAMLVEDFLEREWDSHPRRPEFADPASDAGSPVLLHGHCHQKALWGVQTSSALLARLLGPRLRVLDSGCCGMAGSFGYTADHYELSMTIGELVLLPAVRGAGAGATIVAPGTSCRHQIKDGTGVEAIHPIELVDRMLAK